MSKQFEFDAKAFDAFVSNRSGGVARELERHGDRAVRIATDNVSTPYPSDWVRGNDPPWHLNPPDGKTVFPMQRSETLKKSIKRGNAEPDPGGTIVVEVGAEMPNSQVVDFKFSTNNKNGRAHPDVPYIMIRMDQLTEG